MTTPTPIRCKVPMVDASERGLTPVGTAIFLAIAVLWLIVTSAFAYYRWSLDQTAHEVDAIVIEHNRISYVDADGVTRHAARPQDEGWSPVPGDKLRVRYVPGSTHLLERVETADQQRRMSLILPALALPMFGVAASLHRRMKAEDARRAKLKARALRVPALGFRVERERDGGEMSDIEYRVFARFEHREQQYEAPSDRFLYDPSADIDPEMLKVWLDPDDPRLSMVAADTLPPRRPSGASSRRERGDI